MNKLLPIIIVGILIISGLGAVATTGEEIKQEKMTLSFSQLTIREENQYVTIDMGGVNSVLMKPNQPLLPASIHTFTFPFGTKIKSIDCTPYNIQQQYISKHIMPAPEPVLAGYNAVEKQVEKPVLYGDDPYPNTWFEYDVGCGLKDNERCVFVKVQVFPVQYYPSQNMIKLASEVNIDIEYEPSKNQAATFDEEYDSIVLTPSKYSSELTTLVTHKNNRDVSTKLVTLNDIYYGTYFTAQGRDDPEKIKYFIKNAIETWNTRYVLLVGGDDDLPIRETHVYVNYNEGDDEVFASDLYYADIYDDELNFSSWDSNGNDIFGEYKWGSPAKTDDVDLYPDVHLGRLACTNSGQVSSCVNKIIDYEVNEAYKQDWFTNLVVIGGDTSPHDEDNVDEGEYVNQHIVDIMDGFIPNKIWDSNRKLSGLNPTGVASISNAINEGCGFVDFSGHGSSSVWTTYPHNGSRQTLPTPWGLYGSTDIDSLNNGDKLSIFVTGACSVGKFNKNPNCFTWKFVQNPDGGGIGSFGPASLSWGYTGKWCVKALGGRMQLSLFEGYKEDGAITFGEMWTNAISGYISTNMDGGDHKTIEQWQPFGDPTLAIAKESLAPVKPDAPDGPASGGAGVEYTYNASTTDPDGDDLYYLFDWGDETYSEWIGPKSSGQKVSASHTWIEQKDYVLRVKAKDDHGVQSEWSDPLPISMPKNKQLIDLPFFDILERFPRLFPILRNIFGM